MNSKNDERIRDEKTFMRAIDRLHLLLFAESIKIKSTGKTIEGLSMNLHEMGKLQFALAHFGDEKELEELIDFFTKALERHKTIDRGKKAEVIPFNDKPSE